MLPTFFGFGRVQGKAILGSGAQIIAVWSHSVRGNFDQEFVANRVFRSESAEQV